MDVLHDVTERRQYMRYAVFHYALWYGPYVWIGTSQVFTGEIRVNLERSNLYERHNDPTQNCFESNQGF